MKFGFGLFEFGAVGAHAVCGHRQRALLSSSGWQQLQQSTSYPGKPSSTG